MKIQLDTEQKTITIDEDVKLSKLVEILEKLLPKGEWKKFTLETNTVINRWEQPIIIEKYRRTWPWHEPIVTYGDNTAKPMFEIKSGIYNLDCRV